MRVKNKAELELAKQLLTVLEDVCKEYNGDVKSFMESNPDGLRERIIVLGKSDGLPLDRMQSIRVGFNHAYRVSFSLRKQCKCSLTKK
jgi:hypothetical protein